MTASRPNRLTSYPHFDEMDNFIQQARPGCRPPCFPRSDRHALVGHIRSGRVHTVLVTKLGRLSQSLADLLDLMRLFEQHGVKFISLRDNIDTSAVQAHSSGRHGSRGGHGSLAAASCFYLPGDCAPRSRSHVTRASRPVSMPHAMSRGVPLA